MQPSMGILTLYPVQDFTFIHLLSWNSTVKIHPPFTFIDRKLGQDSRCNLLVQDSPSLYYVFRRRFTHCLIQLAWLGKDSPYPTERYGADSLRPKINKVKIHPTSIFCKWRCDVELTPNAWRPLDRVGSRFPLTAALMHVLYQIKL